MTEYAGLILTLFLLSMISERLADLLKNFLSETNTGPGFFIGRFIGFGNLTSKAPINSIEEKRRAYRILKINFFCGFVTAWASHADLFQILASKENAFDILGWKNVKFVPFGQWIERSGDGILFLLGCLATGLFLSFGSKFWHDLLDIIYQAKNLKRTLDTQTDNSGSGASPSLIPFRAALDDIEQKFVNEEKLLSSGLAQDENGYYIEIVASSAIDDLSNSYVMQHQGRSFVIPVKTKLTNGKKIESFAVTLGSSIFERTKPGSSGTLGCLVSRADSVDNNRYLLTCCHNVIDPISRMPVSDDQILVGTTEIPGLGKVRKAVFDHNVDGALIDLEPGVLDKIHNVVPGVGVPNGTRTFTSEDVNKEMVFLSGAVSKKGSGTLKKVLTNVTIEYGSEKHKLRNLLVVATNKIPLTQKGDSGACVLDSDNRIVGLVVAGLDLETYILPIDILLESFSFPLKPVAI